MKSQSADVPARSVAILMADSQRNGQFIYSVDGVQSEVEETLLKAARDIVGDMNEDVVMAKLMKAISGFGEPERKKYGLTDPGWENKGATD